eukprot:Tamp_08717.p2 GENE.Tamp_08717~~Tamp_08717.p2  ORF type:complete len:257 (-),score=47.92 Tamp_08717:1465-2235(-)
MRCEDWRAVLALALILAHSADAFLAPMPLAPRRPMPGASHRIVCSLRAAASVPHAKRWRGPRAEEEAGGEVCWCCLFASRMGQAAALPRRIALYASSDDQDVRAETSNDGTGAKKRVPGDGRPLAAAEPDAASSRRGAASVQDAAQGEDKVSETMIAALKGYKALISPLLPPSCRFLPTCSIYSMDAIRQFGPSKGVVLTAWRLMRCNPVHWSNGGRGYDPPVWPPVAYNYASNSDLLRQELQDVLGDTGVADDRE